MAFKRSMCVLKRCISTVIERRGQNLTAENWGKDSVYGLTKTPVSSSWYCNNASSLGGTVESRNVRLNTVHHPVSLTVTLLNSVNSEVNQVVRVNSEVNQVVSFSSSSGRFPCVNSRLVSGFHANKFLDLPHSISTLVMFRNFSTLVPYEKKTVSLQQTPHAVSVSCCRRKHSLPKVPPTRMMSVYDIERVITDEEAAKEFVYALKASERKFLYEELARFHGDTDIANSKCTSIDIFCSAENFKFPMFLQQACK